MPPIPNCDLIPSTLRHPRATRFWTAVMLTGAGKGVAAAALTRLLEVVQRFSWSGSGEDLLDAVKRAGAWRHVIVLLGAGLITVAGQIIRRSLSSGNGIDRTLPFGSMPGACRVIHVTTR